MEINLSSSLRQTTPPMTSEWPLIYLEMECKTMSAPNMRGRWKKGDIKVLSTTTSKLFLCAISQRTFKSTIFSVGLVGVSIHNILVSFLISFSNISVLERSMNENSNPLFDAILWKYLPVPIFFFFFFEI